MSFRTPLQRLFGTRQRLAGRLQPTAVSWEAGVHFSVPSLGHGSHASDNDADVLHREKTKHLEGKSSTTLKGAKGWSEALASDSEVAVKADKHHEDSTVEEMQQHTVKTIKVLHEGEHDGEEPEHPKNVPERAKH